LSSPTQPVSYNYARQILALVLPWQSRLRARLIRPARLGSCPAATACPGSTDQEPERAAQLARFNLRRTRAAVHRSTEAQTPCSASAFLSLSLLERLRFRSRTARGAPLRDAERERGTCREGDKQADPRQSPAMSEMSILSSRIGNRGRPYSRLSPFLLDSTGMTVLAQNL
jgi:hypothetical protein